MTPRGTRSARDPRLVAAPPARGSPAVRSAMARVPHAGGRGRAAPAPPGSPGPVTAEPSGFCRCLPGISGANRSSAANPEAGFRPGPSGGGEGRIRGTVAGRSAAPAPSAGLVLRGLEVSLRVISGPGGAGRAGVGGSRGWWLTGGSAAAL